jgi:hypothetical protein
MGCDIHAVLERHFEDEGWQLVAEVTGSADSRDYEFFTHLCGVRTNWQDMGDWPEPKGIPEDISPVTRWKIDNWGDDGHSHSWDTARDFIEKKLALSRIRNDKDADVSFAWFAYKALGYSCDDQEREDERHDCFVDRYRVVYWFDN